MSEQLRHHESYHTQKDILYGEIPITPSDLELFQTREFARLRQVSLSAIPSWTTPYGTASTRAEHCMGVGYLASIVGQKPEFAPHAQNLRRASQFHDGGAPPFSHTAERFLKRVLGVDHEEFAANLLYNTPLGEAMQRQGGDIDTIMAMITGKLPPVSQTLNGSLDIDNIDNVGRFAKSTGLVLDLPYSPRELANAFTLEGNLIAFQPGVEANIAGWEHCRKLVYDHLYSPANLAQSAMLTRAMELAWRNGELHPDFFIMTDPEAFRYLQFDCNPQTGDLLTKLAHWQAYPRVYNFATNEPTSAQQQYLEEFDNRAVLEDAIAEQLGLTPTDIAIYQGKERGYRRIDIPILGNDASFENPAPTGKSRWTAQVYLAPEASHLIPQVREYMNMVLAA